MQVYPCRIGHRSFPNHIALVLDGNRRYGISLLREKELGAFYGHILGGANVLRILRGWIEFTKTPILSVYSLSIGNFKRDEKEVRSLLNAHKFVMQGLLDFEYFKTHEIKVKFPGNKEYLDQELVKLTKEIEEETKNFTGRKFYDCIAYDTKDEIRRATKESIHEGDENFSNYLDVKEDVDLFIRPLESKLSGFLAFQASQAICVTLDRPFPAMTEWDLCGAIKTWEASKRSFGR